MTEKLVYSGISKVSECPACKCLAHQYLFTDGSWKCDDCYTIYKSAQSETAPVEPEPWFSALTESEFKATYEALAHGFTTASRLCGELHHRGGDYGDIAEMADELFGTWQDMFAV